MWIQFVVGEALAVGSHELDQEGQCADKALLVSNHDGFNISTGGMLSKLFCLHPFFKVYPVLQ